MQKTVTETSSRRRVRLLARFRRLTLWNKIALFGSLASLVALVPLLWSVLPLHPTHAGPWLAIRQMIWSQPGIHRIVYCSGDRARTESVTTLLNIRLTNTSSLPREVLDYRVELEMNGHWQRFGRSVAIGNPTSTHIEHVASDRVSFMDVTGAELDRVLLSGPISPGHSAQGWVFLNFYAGEPPAVLATDRLRMIIRDAHGTVTTVTLEPPPEDPVGYASAGLRPTARGWRPPCLSSSD